MSPHTRGRGSTPSPIFGHDQTDLGKRSEGKHALDVRLDASGYIRVNRGHQSQGDYVDGADMRRGEQRTHSQEKKCAEMDGECPDRRRHSMGLVLPSARGSQPENGTSADFQQQPQRAITRCQVPGLAVPRLHLLAMGALDRWPRAVRNHPLPGV